ncbi:MAG: hypothetical protein A2Z20_06390 [Bdellovibrionales bacterium RBG_16_40_8]|nr:MAG: hypothetical protein A2Z20_06390 [Bdellovibrionales bacterium RBG_16_40_8]
MTKIVIAIATVFTVMAAFKKVLPKSFYFNNKQYVYRETADFVGGLSADAYVLQGRGIEPDSTFINFVKMPSKVTPGEICVGFVRQVSGAKTSEFSNNQCFGKMRGMHVYESSIYLDGDLYGIQYIEVPASSDTRTIASDQDATIIFSQIKNLTISLVPRWRRWLQK